MYPAKPELDKRYLFLGHPYHYAGTVIQADNLGFVLDKACIVLYTGLLSKAIETGEFEEVQPLHVPLYLPLTHAAIPLPDRLDSYQGD